MLIQYILFLLGLGILYLGAEWLVHGASSVAIRFGIRPMVVGLTIVALGTSMPEFLLNFFAILMDEDGLAVGNIVGSNISNIALILGMSAVITPLVVGKQALKREYPMMILVTLLFWGLAADGLISRIDGFVLVAFLIGLMIYLIRDTRRTKTFPVHDPETMDDPQPIMGNFLHRLTGGSAHWKRVLLLVGGMAGLAVGARLMVTSAVAIAHALEIQPVVIGLTIVAIGTSLPELAASLVCAVKDESDMSVGNILGSNMLNILFVVGTVALIQPMHVEAESLRTHFPVMVGFSLLLFPLTLKGHRLSRPAGFILLTGFVGYLAWLIVPYL